MIESVCEVAKEAGRLVLGFHGKPSTVATKADNSPLTLADQASHDFLTAELARIKPIPVLSEEKDIPYETRKGWREFWLIDPLDGTKEFIGGFEDFCINIALVRGVAPVLGVIHAPALRETFWAEKGGGFHSEGRTAQRKAGADRVVAVSRFHHSEKTERFIKANGLTHLHPIGAALKFTRLATGEIDLYPRFEGSSEWDTGAGQIIVEEAGGSMVDLATRVPPVYNKPSVRNNYFIALAGRARIDDLHLWELMT